MTRFRRARIAAALLALPVLSAAFAPARPAAAQEIGALAVHPGGGTVMAAGTNRTLYTIDGAAMQVTDRRYLPEAVAWLDYDPEGRRLYMLTGEDVLSAHSGGSLKTLFRVEDVDVLSHAKEAGRIAVMENRYDGGIVRLLDAATGAVLARIELPGIRTALIALAPDGRRALVLSQAESSEAEPKESTPADLKGHARYLHRQRHDGYVSQVLALDFDTGAVAQAETFFRASGAPDAVTMLDGRMLVLNTASDSALIAADGTAEMLDLGEDYVAFSGLAAGGGALVLAGGSAVRVARLDGAAAGEVLHALEAGRLPGPSERVTAMGEAADGTVWLGTSAYRLWKIAPGAPEVEAAPVY